MSRQYGFNWKIPALAALSWVLVASAFPAAAFDAKQADQSVLRIVNFEVLKTGKIADSAGIGTGFVVANEYVVTNHHVISDSEYTARGSTAKRMVVDGTLKNIRPAELVWQSVELDLAVLKVPGLTRPALTLTGLPPTSYPTKGEIVWAIGYPGMADTSIKTDAPIALESTLTQGIVAGIRQGKNPTYGDKIRPVIQHSSSINKGNSGGPLFDNCGAVIGVNTFAPVSIMYVGTEKEAQGMPNSGIFYAPHIANFIEAQRTVPELKAINLTLATAPCATATGDTGEFPIWAYAAIGVVGVLAIAATVLALRKGTTREVVRMVESYSAYVKRKGRAPSDYSLQPRKLDMSPSAAAKLDATGSGPSQPKTAAAAGPGWTLSGKGGQGQSIKQSISADKLAQATSGKEQGLIIGRSSTLADISVDDPSVSRRHAKIYATETGLALEDLKSAFGTRVNGHKLEPFQAVEIKAGDRIALGGVELTLAASN